jgi:hypothetical protein
MDAQPINGASAGLNVWNPLLDYDYGIFTLSQIGLINYHQPLEIIQIGWVVSTLFITYLNVYLF